MFAVHLAGTNYERGKERGGGFKDARSGLLGERRRMELTVRGYGPLVL